MVFAHVPALKRPLETSSVLGGILSSVLSKQQYYYVTNQDGLTGYVKAGRCTILSQDTDRYFDAARRLQQTTGHCSPDTSIRVLHNSSDEGAMADSIYAAPERPGLDFDPYHTAERRKTIV